MSGSPQPVIEVHGLEKQFRYWSDRPASFKSVLVDMARGKFSFGERVTFTALKNIDFTIRKGEFVGIMGRNGAGKSTLLKLICGIYTPTSGSIQVNESIAPLIELGAGFHGDLSGYENIFLNAAILGFGRDAANAALKDILDFSELGEMIHMPVKNYSSGMLVRLGFSIATQLAAPILLVDEVLAVGDAGFQAKCIKRIQQLHREGRTVVLITHNDDAVRKYCDRCIVIDRHEKVFDGPADKGVEVYRNAVLSDSKAARSWEKVCPGLEISRVLHSESGDLFALGVDQNVWRWSVQRQDWEKAAPGPMSWIAMGHDGQIYGIGSDGAAQRTVPGSGVWETVAPAGYTGLTLGRDGSIFGIGSDWCVYRTRPGHGAWERVTEGHVRQIEIAADGRIYASSFDGCVYSAIAGAGQWQNEADAPNSYMTLSKSGELFGVGRGHAVFRKGSITREWEQMTQGSVSQIVLSPEGTIYGVGLDRALYRCSIGT